MTIPKGPMVLRDLIKLVDKSDKNSNDGDIGDFCQALNMQDSLGWSQRFSDEVQGYWLIKWLCTDTWVGCRVWFLDGEPVAISNQSARKNPTEIEFISQDAVDKLRKLINEIIGEEEQFTPTMANLDEVIEDLTYTVSYAEALLVSEGLYKGMPVSVIRRGHWGDSELGMQQIIVRGPAGDDSTINVTDLHIPMHITPVPE